MTKMHRTQGARRRQPQTSCDFCRTKKLKCDRAEPCSNCVARGLSCRILGQHVATGRAGMQTDVQERLRRLEEAVFGDHHGSQKGLSSWSRTPGRETNSVRRTADARVPARDSRNDMEVFDNSDAVMMANTDRLSFRVAPSRVAGLHPGGTPSSDTTDAGHPAFSDLSECIWLPHKSDAFALFEDYIANTDHYLRIVHEPAARNLIDELYNELRYTQVAPLGPAALVLAICAAGASFWSKNQPGSRCHFTSEEESSRQSVMWREASCRLLDRSQRVTPGSLEDVQAMIILRELVNNCEGVSAQVRYLHNHAISVAREIYLHMTDVPGQEANENDSVLQETKRRVWWHLVSEDWLLGTLGGPTDRTYFIHPNHMRVDLPRTINGEEVSHSTTCPDSSLPPPTERVTQMKFFLQRVRLAELSRKIVDLLPPGFLDIDHLPYEQILQIDKELESFLSETPQVFLLGFPFPPDAPAFFDPHRQILHLAFHGRRARLYRPFLQPASTATDPRKTRFRITCLASAHAVVEIASSLLEQSLSALSSPASTNTPRMSVHRSGTVINHLFMACVVLMTEPANNGGIDAGLADTGNESRRADLTKACRLLERAGEESVMAASMLQKLIRVMQRHRVPGVDAAMGSVKDEVAAQVQHHLPLTASNCATQQQQQQPLPQNTQSRPNDFMFAAPQTITSPIQQQGTAHLLNGMITPPSAFAPFGTLDPRESGLEGGDTWMFDPTLGFNGAWEDLFNTVPTSGDGWNQLFVDLDMFGATM